MNRVISLILPFCIFITLIAAHAEAKQNKDLHFKKRLQLIEALVVDLTSPHEVFRSELFVEVWKSPIKYQKDVVYFIAEELGTETQKKIAILSMQNLPLSNYVNFCEDVFRIWKKHKITDDILWEAVFPGYDWNTKLQENYRNPLVRNLLVGMKKSGPLPKEVNSGALFSDFIDITLSGKALEQIRELRRAKQLHEIRVK